MLIGDIGRRYMFKKGAALDLIEETNTKNGIN